MNSFKTLKLTSDKPQKEFILQNSISHIELMEIRCLHLMDNSNWHQELMNNPLRLRIELSCLHSGPTAKFETLIANWMGNTQQPVVKYENKGIEVPDIGLRLPMAGSNVSHYDKMVLTLFQNDSTTPVSVEFIYNDYLKTPAFSVRCFNCRNRNDFPDHEIDWEVEEVSERQMGVETMYSGEFSSNCKFCQNPLSVQFYYWEYPTNVLNYHEHKAENCLLVENPNFIERHFEEYD